MLFIDFLHGYFLDKAEAKDHSNFPKNKISDLLIRTRTLMLTFSEDFVCVLNKQKDFEL